MTSTSIILNKLYKFARQNVISHENKNDMQDYLHTLQCRFNFINNTNSRLQE